MLKMDFIHRDTRLSIIGNTVVMHFPSEDDAIIFSELVREIMHGAHKAVTLSMKEGESDADNSESR